MPPRTPPSRCWTRCRIRRRSACGSTAARCRAGRSARPVATPSSCSRWAAWTATGRRPSSRSAPSAARGRTPIAYALEQAANDLGSGASRTIVLVSDGKDTCQPPSPCSVAQRVAKGGVEMRIQAIGFNVDPEARAELECIASAGGGVYRDATDAESLRDELRALDHARAARVRPQGQGDQGRPERPPGDADHPRPVHRPGAAGHRALVRDRPQARRDAEGQPVVHPAAAARGDHRRLRLAGDRHADFDLADERNSAASGHACSDGAGSSTGLGVVSRPIGVGEQAEPDAPFTKPGRYYLKLALEDTSDKAALQRHRRQPYTSEMAVEVLGRGRNEKQPKHTASARWRARRPARAARHAAAGRCRRRARGRRLRRRCARALEAARMRLALLPRRGRSCCRPRPGADGDPGRRRRLVQHRAAAGARSLRRHRGRGRDRVLEGQARARARSCGCARRSTVRDRDRLPEERLLRRAWTISTTSSTCGARCASRSRRGQRLGGRAPSSKATTPSAC